MLAVHRQRAGSGSLLNVRTRLITAVSTLLLAHAQASADNPRDLFGLGPKKPDGKPAGAAAKPAAPAALPPVTQPLEQSPAAVRWSASATQLLRLPTGDLPHDAMAVLAMGVGRDDAGVVIGGASGLENRWTIGAAPIDDVSTGGASTGLPLQFLDQLHVQIGGFAAHDRVSTGGVIDAELRRGGPRHHLKIWGSYGLAADRTERATVPQNYQLMRSSLQARHTASAGALADGPIATIHHAPVWYVLGLAATVQQKDLLRTGARLVDTNQDGVPDLDGESYSANFVLEPIYHARQNSASVSFPGMARVGWSHASDEVTVTLLGTAARNTRFVTNSMPAAAAVDRWFVTGDAIANWTHRFRHGRLQLTAAWHRNLRLESAHDSAGANEPQRLSAYLPDSLGAPELTDACADGGATDVFSQIPNCPIPGWFASGGVGRLIDTTGDRPSASIDYAHTLGSHMVRVGGTGEDSRIINIYRFSGGRFIRSLFPTHVDSEYYVRPGTTCTADDPTVPCSYVSATEQRFRTRYLAAFLEDTWRPTSDLTLNAGLRWESMQVGSALDFANQWAPRLSAAWDPIGHGRSRVFWSFGRSHAMLPVGVAEAIAPAPATGREYVSQFGSGRIVDATGGYAVFAPIEPITVDEVVGGVEAGLANTVTMRMWGQARWQRQALETTPLGLSNLDRAVGVPARQAQLLATELITNPLRDTAVRFGYQWGRSVGSTAGAYDPAQGIVQFTGTDFGSGTDNLYGRLPNDQGHRFYAELYRGATVKGLPVSITGRAVLSSGRPRNAVAQSGDATVQLVPRGSLERTPMVATVNVRAAVRYAGVEFGLEVFNLFDRRTATAVDDVYSRSVVRPIVGGKASDLVFLRDVDGVLAVRSPGYGQALGFQAPIFALLNIRTEI